MSGGRRRRERGDSGDEARAKNAFDRPSPVRDHAAMDLRKFVGIQGSCLALVVVSGCSGGPPEVPSNVTSVSGRHDHEGVQAVSEHVAVAPSMAGASLRRGEHTHGAF